MNYLDTIAAVATGGGVSAIGIVRVSGSIAINAASSIFQISGNISLSDAQDRHMYYGKLTNASGELIDLCLCFISRAPNSYTGEDTVEFHCHGSPVVLSEVLQALFSHGVRQAKEGEFTKRAFLNGRMDLTQAEAVIDLIEAETPLGAKNAAGQLSGAVYTKMNAVYKRLIDISAHFYAVIDYPDEYIDEFHLYNYAAELHNTVDMLNRMIATHKHSRFMREGIPAAIVGRVNTGKSSLLNALLGYNRAIVTDIAGTTRDTVEEKAIIGGLLLRLIDTAGLRDTSDVIEMLGVERTVAALENASLVLFVLEGSQALSPKDFDIASKLPPNVPIIVVINKSDLPIVLEEKELDEIIGKILCQQVSAQEGKHMCPCYVSALTGEGLVELEAEICRLFPETGSFNIGEVITSVRQAEALDMAVKSLQCAISALTDAVTPDAVLSEIESTLTHIGEVIGRTVRDDVVNRIFERFCVGK